MSLLTATAVLVGSSIHGSRGVVGFAPPSSFTTIAHRHRSSFSTTATLAMSTELSPNEINALADLADEINALTLDPDSNNNDNNSKNDNNSSSRGGAVQIIEGYGFSTSIARILKSSVGMGYYDAKASESVIDVMEGINSNNNNSDRSDVALVFDDANPTILRGIFTDADYIRLAMERSQTCDLDESVAFVAAPVSNFITPATELICVDESNTASQAVAVMTSNDIRHVVVLDKCGPNFSYDPSTKIMGVISMQDILRVIQIDERLTFNKLTQKYPLLADRPIEQMREEMKSRANKLASNEETGKRDIIRAGAALLAAGSVALFVTEGTWLSSHAELVMIGIFVLGYVGIIFEEVFEFNKAAVALLMSTGLWITYADFYGDANGSASLTVLDQLKDQLAEVSDICFFLLAASAIVEVVDAHQGFKVVTNLITTKSKKGLFWVIGFLTFFLSAILNNLTVTIVMVSLLRKLIPNDDDRRLFGAMVVVAANAGGVWTPIGDVTTTMLWINNQLSTVPTVTQLFLPSLACLVVSMFVMVQQVKEDTSLTQSTLPPPSPLATRGQVVFWAGIASLLAVPVFSELTGLPPYLAMLTGLGAIWTLTDIIHMGEEEDEMMVPAALAKLDTSGILFFLGILMSIGVLDKSGLLKELAVFLNDNLPSQDIIATVIGIASALIDNVPLVAATMGMYDLTDYGTDDKLWQLIALCAGTGGSILVIGSASGVALMGLEKVDFLWYAKRVTVGATIGYFAGIATYLLENAVLTGTLLGGGVVAP